MRTLDNSILNEYMSKQSLQDAVNTLKTSNEKKTDNLKTEIKYLENSKYKLQPNAETKYVDLLINYKKDQLERCDFLENDWIPKIEAVLRDNTTFSWSNTDNVTSKLKSEYENMGGDIDSSREKIRNFLIDHMDLKKYLNDELRLSRDFMGES